MAKLKPSEMSEGRKKRVALLLSLKEMFQDCINDRKPITDLGFTQEEMLALRDACREEWNRLREKPEGK